MKWEKLILILVAALTVVCAGWGAYFLRDARLWRFSTFGLRQKAGQRTGRRGRA